ncbi:PTS transporter subunit EIIC [Aerococcus kribbianus]|uniref:PTS transporter subunit EIIC n=1 Tax=Aerococcus kribbianus TaxID=2999064 RepID=A0A9X3FMC8_9LACT|nr:MULTISPECIES: PTS transporter subunit EIIC [unclassified Aerococcus]MCZ0716889.1 PTS transporter subunit EIIC [Aerococcus sp. YH-aer221]MCZ0725177.1 PTS transporter subunit EIIC [Aerococcus sp. YH-aer222]
MSDKQIAQEILKTIGGPDNIENYSHCATRLRIVLKDNSLVDKDHVDTIDDLKGYFYSTGQHQFVFGTGRVNQVYQAVESEINSGQGDSAINSTEADEMSHDGEANQNKDKKKDKDNMNPAQRVVRVLADILVPLIPVLVTTGLLMGIRGLLTELGFTLSDDINAIFTLLTDTAFAFLPVFITYSAVKKFNGNPILGIAVGLMLVAPQLPNAYDVASGASEPLQVMGIEIFGYQGTIFPAIIAGWLIAKIESWFRKFVPSVIDLIVTPFFTITITLAIMLFILGPIIQVIESAVIGFIVNVINAPLGIGYIIFGGLQQLLVVTGLHHSLSIIEISLLDHSDANILNPLMTASMAGQFGAAISAALLMKDKVKRSQMISSALPTLFGITEPLLFGVNMRSLRILLSGIAGGALGGLTSYLFSLSASGMGITFLPGLLLYTSSFATLMHYFIVILVAFVVGFVVVKVQSKQIRQEIV